jgi:hypothetical protein
MKPIGLTAKTFRFVTTCGEQGSQPGSRTGSSRQRINASGKPFKTMGADLFIPVLHQKHHEKWQKRFDQAARRRNRLQDGTPQHAEAQKQVELCYGKMYERGYFRDSYNDSNLLWKFGLSWWNDIIPLLDDDRYLPVQKQKTLLTMLKEREPAFEDNLKKIPTNDRQYFLEKYEALQSFLGEAIALDSLIECSL